MSDVRRTVLHIVEVDFHGGFLFSLLDYDSAFADDEEEDDEDCEEKTKGDISICDNQGLWTKEGLNHSKKDMTRVRLTYTTLMSTGIPVFCHVLTGIAAQSPWLLHCLLKSSTIERV